MFIPRGKALHENLATSYVLVDALVTDLCEGSFSGIVELVLQNREAHVIICRGKVAAVIERRDGSNYSRTTVAELAAASRGERGRVSVYAHSAETTGALANRLAAEPLYTQLSTEFVNLEKMISKLSREPDREWFIEIDAGSAGALIYINGDHCQVIRPGEVVEDEGAHLGLNNPALQSLIEECNRTGNVFDVYFRRPTAEVEVREVEPVAAPVPEEVEAADKHPAETETQPEAERFAEAAAAGWEYVDVDRPYADEVVEQTPITDDEAARIEPAIIEKGEADELIMELSEEEAELPPDALAKGLSDNTRMLLAEALLHEEDGGTARMADHSPVSTEEAVVMAEVKRLMGEIARTIEEATRAAEQRDSFSMYLRAGQLKIADRYPFLDPFGAEFEYLAGEIAFIGKAGPEEFIAALTEALRLAVIGVAQSSAQPARFRAYVTQDLHTLLHRHQSEFERFGLDRSIEQILSDQ